MMAFGFSISPAQALCLWLSSGLLIDAFPAPAPAPYIIPSPALGLHLSEVHNPTMWHGDPRLDPRRRKPAVKPAQAADVLSEPKWEHEKTVVAEEDKGGFTAEEQKEHFKKYDRSGDEVPGGVGSHKGRVGKGTDEVAKEGTGEVSVSGFEAVAGIPSRKPADKYEDLKNWVDHTQGRFDVDQPPDVPMEELFQGVGEYDEHYAPDWEDDLNDPGHWDIVEHQADTLKAISSEIRPPVTRKYSSWNPAGWFSKATSKSTSYTDESMDGHGTDFSSSQYKEFETPSPAHLTGHYDSKVKDHIDSRIPYPKDALPEMLKATQEAVKGATPGDEKELQMKQAELKGVKDAIVRNKAVDRWIESIPSGEGTDYDEPVRAPTDAILFTKQHKPLPAEVDRTPSELTSERPKAKNDSSWTSWFGGKKSKSPAEATKPGSAKASSEVATDYLTHKELFPNDAKIDRWHGVNIKNGEEYPEYPLDTLDEKHLEQFNHMNSYSASEATRSSDSETEPDEEVIAFPKLSSHSAKRKDPERLYGYGPKLVDIYGKPIEAPGDAPEAKPGPLAQTTLSDTTNEPNPKGWFNRMFSSGGDHKNEPGSKQKEE
ncbi:hypothetical protein BJ508DRAFT_364824 [Ascobolus immersus RN42]|uniref:Uncharacterized protein n=1 Tax=Ascobolus immersus RN42 TaxID=1160509 RepID=A0A3N4HYB9_ASCIM|nr:hypothetical protein BJ508DRAFT_364824 [Ascobolus immersus RN42]